MNLLFICARLPYPPNRGDAIRVFHLQSELSKLGAQISVLSPYFDDDEKRHANDYKKTLPITLYTAFQNNIYLRYIRGLITNTPLTLSHFFNKKINQRVKHYLKSHFFDAIICTNSVNIEYIIQNQELINPKTLIIIDHMDLDSDKWRQYANQCKTLKKFIFKREAHLIEKLEKNIQSIADFSLFTSKKEVELYEKLIGPSDKLRVISNGIDNKYFSPTVKKLDSKKPILLFTGVMDYYPNEQGAIWFAKNVWPQILKSIPEAQFIIAGMNPTSEVKQLAKLQGVEVTGFVKDINKYYQLADIYIAPLHIARGIQNKILEAFASNKPVISTPNALQGILCADKEHLLIARDPDEFITNINLLISNLQLREKLTTNALELVNKKYSWQGQAQKLYHLIQN